MRTYRVGDEVSLAVTVTTDGNSAAHYRWRRNGIDVESPAMTGAYIQTDGAVVILSPAAAADAGIFDVVVSNACGSTLSDPILLAVGCPADFNADGEVNGGDVSDYINAWYLDIINGTVLADFNTDGETNGADVSDYINAWYSSLVCGGYCC